MAIKLAKVAKAVPVARLLAAGEIVMMARQHWHRLEPAERRRFVALVRRGHGRKRNLSERDQAELARLIAKANPRLFVGLVAQRFSPVPLPRRVVHGRRRRA
jgi:TRAP-type C4-dicarboxylate transport system substrate-binding protein